MDKENDEEAKENKDENNTKKIEVIKVEKQEKEFSENEEDSIEVLEQKLAEAKLKNQKENEELKEEQEKPVKKDESKKKIKSKKISKIINKVPKRVRLIIGAIITILLIVLILIIIIPKISNSQKVITIGDTIFTKADYMMYLKIAKDDYFGKEIEEIPDATLKTVVAQESGLTLQRYLKLKAEENLKIAGVIEKVAKENNIKLTEEDLKEIKEEKQNQIDKLGGKSKFSSWISKNKTTEEAYDKMLKANKLYNLIYEKLYTDGNIKDLTEEQKAEVSKEYNQNYTKIRQIVLLTVNPITTEKITETEKQQKKLLADTIKNNITASNFDEYIKKYSDNAIGLEPPYAVYFVKGQLLETIENTASNLKYGEISEVIESEYAYHIILRDELDNEYLEKLYETSRDKKLLNDITEQINSTTIIIEDALEEIKVR